MDARHFDSLTRWLSADGSRRGLLGALAALPLAGGLLGILAPEDAAAAGASGARSAAGSASGSHAGRSLWRRPVPASAEPSPTPARSRLTAGRVTVARRVRTASRARARPVCRGTASRKMLARRVGPRPPVRVARSSPKAVVTAPGTASLPARRRATPTPGATATPAPPFARMTTTASQDPSAMDPGTAPGITAMGKPAPTAGSASPGTAQIASAATRPVMAFARPATLDPAPGPARPSPTDHLAAVALSAAKAPASSAATTSSARAPGHSA